MCYAASLGGILTLVGTSTNLLVNSLMVGRGMPALQIFDLFPVGIIIVLACGATMLADLSEAAEGPAAAAKTSLSDYFLEATVRAGSQLVGRTVEANGLRQLAHLFLTEIVRDGQRHRAGGAGRGHPRRRPAGLHRRRDAAGPAAAFDGLETHGQHYQLPLDNLVEVVVAGNSTLARRTIKEVDFRSQFDAAVIAVRRGSERVAGAIANMPLAVGDTLVLVVGKDFEKRNNIARNFVIVARARGAEVHRLAQGPGGAGRLRGRDRAVGRWARWTS